MLITIDGKEMPDMNGEGQVLAEVLTNAKKSLEGTGRMVVAIECDGRNLPPEEIEKALRGPATTYWQVNFVTTNPLKLAADALNATSAILAEVQQLNETTANLLSQSQIKDAMGMMGQLCSRWNDAYKGVYNVIRLLGLDPAAIELSTTTAEKVMGRLGEHLQQVKVTLETQDYVQLADILNYELGPQVDDWRTIVNSLLERVTEE
jgi:hypothetical protein